MPTKATSTTKSTKSPTTTKENTPAMPTTKTPPKRKPQTIDSEPHPLAHYIPDQWWIDNYIGREIAGVNDMDLFRAAHDSRHNILLYGPTGAAKTSAIYAYAASIGMPVVNVACNGGIDKEQLLGGWQPKTDGGYHFVPGDLVLGVMHGAVILLNEVNFMPPKIAALVYGLLDRRRTIYLPDAAGSDFPTRIKAHDRTVVFADYNPGYSGTRTLNYAFKNRFAFKVQWGYDHDVEDQLLVSETLLTVVEQLRKQAEVGDISTPISTNMAMEFEGMVYTDGLGFDFAVANFIAAFEPEEQPAVAEVLNRNREAIMAELELDDTDTDTEVSA